MTETDISQIPFVVGCLLVVAGIGATATSGSVVGWSAVVLGIGLLLVATVPRAVDRLQEV